MALKAFPEATQSTFNILHPNFLAYLYISQGSPEKEKQNQELAYHGG